MFGDGARGRPGTVRGQYRRHRAARSCDRPGCGPGRGPGHCCWHVARAALHGTAAQPSGGPSCRHPRAGEPVRDEGRSDHRSGSHHWCNHALPGQSIPRGSASRPSTPKAVSPCWRSRLYVVQIHTTVPGLGSGSPGVAAADQRRARPGSGEGLATGPGAREREGEGRWYSKINKYLTCDGSSRRRDRSREVDAPCSLHPSLHSSASRTFRQSEQIGLSTPSIFNMLIGHVIVFGACQSRGFLNRLLRG